MNARNIAWNARIIALKVERKVSVTKVMFVSLLESYSNIPPIHNLNYVTKSNKRRTVLKTHERLLR